GEHGDRLRILVQEALNELPDDLDDVEETREDLIKAMGLLDTEAAWRMLDLDAYEFDFDLPNYIAGSAAQQGNTELVDHILRQASEDYLPELTARLEKHVPEKVLSFIRNLGPVVFHDECLRKIAERYLLEKNVDKAWQIINMAKQDRRPQTAYTYDNIGKEGQLYIVGYVEPAKIAEIVKAIQNSNITQHSKNILTDHFVCNMRDPEVAWKLVKQFIPNSPLAYIRQEFLPIYLHLVTTQQGLENAYSYKEQKLVPFSASSVFSDFLFWLVLIKDEPMENFPRLISYSALSECEIGAVSCSVAELLGPNKKLDSETILDMFDDEGFADFLLPASRGVLEQDHPLSVTDSELLIRLSTKLSVAEHERFFKSIIRRRPLERDAASNLTQIALREGIPASLWDTLIPASWEPEPEKTLELIKQRVREPLNLLTHFGFLSTTSHTEEARMAFSMYSEALERELTKDPSLFPKGEFPKQLHDVSVSILGRDELYSFIAKLEKWTEQLASESLKEEFLDVIAALTIGLDIEQGYQLMMGIEDPSRRSYSLLALARRDKDRLAGYIKQYTEVDSKTVFLNAIDESVNAIDEADFSIDELMIVVQPFLEGDRIHQVRKVVEKLASTDLQSAIDYVKQDARYLHNALIEPMVKASRTDELVCIFEDYQAQKRSQVEYGAQEVLINNDNDEFYTKLVGHLAEFKPKSIPGYFGNIIYPRKLLAAYINCLNALDPNMGGEFVSLFETSISLARAANYRSVFPKEATILNILEIGLEKLPIGYITFKIIDNKSFGTLSPRMLSLWILKAFPDKSFRSLLTMVETETEKTRKGI
ncbi:hypothetical protein ACFL6S_25480, partial [Candidatus Poribacteria bacterium]